MKDSQSFFAHRMSNSNTNLKHIIKNYKDNEPPTTKKYVSGSTESKSNIPAVIPSIKDQKARSSTQKPLAL